MNRIFLISFAFFIFLGLTSAITFSVWLYGSYTESGPLTQKTMTIIPKGAGSSLVAHQLKSEKIIADEFVFLVGMVIWDGDKSFKAGEFSIPKRASARKVASIIQSGKTAVRRITIPEGHTKADIIRKLIKVDGLVGKVPSNLFEGDFLPETYYYSYGDSREKILRRMRNSMNKTTADLWQNRKKGLPIRTRKEAIILASIVEKETAISSERSRVAGVFINRLNKGMRLQSDPTVVYGLTKGLQPLGRPLLRRDLKSYTPYNTYIINGLPPGPISNPGRASIEAVLHPLDTDELYFVSDGQGAHRFSKTLKKHNINVAKFRAQKNKIDKD